MTVNAVLKTIRNLLNDNIPPYLWGDDELVDYLNLVLMRLSNETNEIIKENTGVVVSIVTIDGVNKYELDQSIVTIERVVNNKTANNKTYALQKTTIEDLDKTFKGWESLLGLPLWYAVINSNYLLLYPTPDTAYDIDMNVIKRPSLFLLPTQSNFELPILGQYHVYVFNGILSYAYQKADEQTFSEQNADKYMQLFLSDIENIKRQEIKKRSADSTAKANWGCL